MMCILSWQSHLFISDMIWEIVSPAPGRPKSHKVLHTKECHQTDFLKHISDFLYSTRCNCSNCLFLQMWWKTSDSPSRKESHWRTPCTPQWSREHWRQGRQAQTWTFTQKNDNNDKYYQDSNQYVKYMFSTKARVDKIDLMYVDVDERMPSNGWSPV